MFLFAEALIALIEFGVLMNAIRENGLGV